MVLEARFVEENTNRVAALMQEFPSVRCTPRLIKEVPTRVVKAICESARQGLKAQVAIDTKVQRIQDELNAMKKGGWLARKNHADLVRLRTSKGTPGI